jgi:hypothetical protein
VIGHVEPTFDWTLSLAETGQAPGGHIVSALSTNLFNDQPLGYAFDEYRAGVGDLHTQWARLRDKLNTALSCPSSSATDERMPML